MRVCSRSVEWAREREKGGRERKSREGEIEGAWEKGRDRRKIEDRESKSEKE